MKVNYYLNVNICNGQYGTGLSTMLHNHCSENDAKLILSIMTDIVWDPHNDEKKYDFVISAQHVLIVTPTYCDCSCMTPNAYLEL